MASLLDLQNQLREFPCHFMWELEKKSIKQFGSLMKLVDEHINDSPAMVIEGLLFKSYLFFSEFKGNAEKKKTESMKCIKDVRDKILKQDTSRQPHINGYLLIAIALEAWFDSRDQKKLKGNIGELQRLESLYVKGSPEHNMFKGSIHATKGFALSRVGMHRYTESITEFETALELCPMENDWRFSVGLVRWRLAKDSAKYRNHVCDDIKDVLSIFYNVSEMNPNHSYALVLIAEIRRRQGFYDKAEYFVNSALEKIPVNRKILGEAIGVYRRMAYFHEAIRVIHVAEQLEESSSFIYHQAYLVYRDISSPKYRCYYSYPSLKLHYLKKATEANPSNLYARCDYAKELVAAEATEYFNQLLENFKDDFESVICINYNFALFLQKQKKCREANDKFQKVVDVALDECKQDGGPPIIFFKEVNERVKQSIQHIEKFHEDVINKDPRNVTSRLQLAELKDKLGNTKRACWHFQQVLDLKLNIDKEREWEILQYLAKVKTKNGMLGDVDSIIENMTKLNISHPRSDVINESKAALAVQKGKVALREIKREDAIKLFLESVTLGNLTGAKLLLEEVKQMKRRDRNFYIYCAHIDICIESSLEENKELLHELKEGVTQLLSADSVGVVLQDLRKKQFEMECSVLKNSANLVITQSEVVHKCRKILNQTMAKFRDRHYGNVDQCDYFNIPKCSSDNIAEEVRKKLEKGFKWKKTKPTFKFSQEFPHLFKFLVSSQPAYNPQENNWLFALFRMDNSDKHERPLEDKLKVKVYSDKLGNMEEREFITLDVAREACDKITTLLDEFYKYLQ